MEISLSTVVACGILMYIMTLIFIHRCYNHKHISPAFICICAALYLTVFFGIFLSHFVHY